MVTGIPHETTADYGGPGGSDGTGGVVLGARPAALIWVPVRLAAEAG